MVSGDQPVKKIIIALFFTGLFIGIFSYPASAFAEWETAITVSSGNAESRLTFGQKLKATDLADGIAPGATSRVAVLDQVGLHPGGLDAHAKSVQIRQKD